MKKLYLIFLALLILFIPTTNAVAVYQLDQPVRELDGYTLREVFENRNMAMPDLSTATDLGDGNYRLYNQFDIILDYNVNSGVYTLNGTIGTGQNVRILMGSVIGWVEGNTYTSSINVLSTNSHSGSSTFETISINTGGNYSPYWVADFRNVLNGGVMSSTYSNQNNSSFNLRLFKGSSHNPSIFTDWQFTLQIEKGDTATPYTVPGQIPQYKIVGEE